LINGQVYISNSSRISSDFFSDMHRSFVITVSILISLEVLL